ncbi:MAG: aminotransferase [Pseudomonadota bacterium]
MAGLSKTYRTPGKVPYDGHPVKDFAESTMKLNPVFADRPHSIFPTMSALARRHGAINLGQGFPDEDGPAPLLRAASDALVAGPNQYVPVEGIPALRQAVAAAHQRFYGIDLDPDTNVVVTAGATEGLAAAFLAFCAPGDEVIFLSPFYECYAPQAEAAGALCRFVSLTPPHWRIDESALRAAISPRTKLVVINTPHNPTGHVMDEDELEIVARVARDHDLIVLCDEVYEHMVFDGRPHLPLMAFEGMAERCVRFGSAGKTFSVTGWRIGYASGPASLIEPLNKAHQFLAYTSPGHLQQAVAQGLGFDNDYFGGLTRGMQDRRDLLSDQLSRAGFDVLPCEGTYFLSVDIRSVGRDDDRAFCAEITEHAKVAAVPVSAFYHPSEENVPKHLARFCFAKKPGILTEAARRLATYFR